MTQNFKKIFISSFFIVNLCFGQSKYHLTKVNIITSNYLYVKCDFKPYNIYPETSTIRMNATDDICGSFEIASEPFRGPMTFANASISVGYLLNGWRLPTAKELIVMKENAAKLGIIVSGSFWTIERDNDNLDSQTRFFFNGNKSEAPKGTKNQQDLALVWPVKSNMDGNLGAIIGNTYSIGNYEVAEYDFPIKTTYTYAQSWVNSLNTSIKAVPGKEWRIPSYEEWKVIYKPIYNFTHRLYWCSDKPRLGSFATKQVNYYKIIVPFKPSQTIGYSESWEFGVCGVRIIRNKQ